MSRLDMVFGVLDAMMSDENRVPGMETDLKIPAQGYTVSV
jgi:hypothetical protein